MSGSGASAWARCGGPGASGPTGSRPAAEAMVPNLWEVMSGTEPSQFFQNFRIAAGLAEGNHRGPGLERRRLLQVARGRRGRLRHHQGRRPRPPDGRGHRRHRPRPATPTATCTRPVLIRRPQRRPRRRARSSDRLDFETYNLGHLITAACVHHRATGKANLLDVAVKAADFLAEAVRTPTDRAGPQRRLPVALHGGRRALPDHPRPRATWSWPASCSTSATASRTARTTTRTASRSAGRRRPPATPSGPTTSTPARPTSYAETGDRTLLEPLLEDLGRRRLPEDVRHRRLRGPLRRRLARRRRRTRSPSPGSIRPTAATTSCPTARPTTRPARRSATSSGTGGCSSSPARPGSPTSWSWSLYNAVLAGISLDGTRFFYTNTLRQLDEMPAELRWSRERQPFISCFCCPPNVVRTIAEVGELRLRPVGRRASGSTSTAAARSTPSSPAASRLRLTQETDYPWDGRVTITRRGRAPSRRSRSGSAIPGWADGASLSRQRHARPRPARSPARMPRSTGPGRRATSSS